ncbi:hypothetical protein [Allokutzneria oryzae]|uniref:CHAD domain-containing protein n=1 Tax=Allokutzneria oryzae TaxID=1378989 RepID=A0ABV5ZSM4_9PSEU
MDTEAIAAELYGLPPSEFTAARNAWVAEAKQAGDTGAAKAISALRKPSTAAWLANRLVRAHPGDVDDLLRVGEELRAAHTGLDGARLRELGQRRHRAVRALLRLAASMHSPLSDSVERELEQILTTATSNADAAAVLAAGRLTTTLRPDDEASWPEVTAPLLRMRPRRKLDRLRLARAEAELAAAREAFRAAEERLRLAEEDVERLGGDR